MNYSSELREELAAWATLASLRLPVNPAQVIDALGGPRPLFELSAQELRKRLPWTASQAERVISAEPAALLPFLDRFIEGGGDIIVFSNEGYPPLLKEISCPPAALWCRGGRDVLVEPLVAIVGSRKPTRYGLRAAELLASELASAGVGVVSGGAYGIDAAAHNGTLEAGGKTVAVLGTGIDKDYPAAHRALFERVSHQGACVTEFGPGTPPLAGHFPIRNRLISGLCRGVVVVEAGAKSGALITARFALEQNREVFAVPGEIFNELSAGPNSLLHAGARLVRGVDDILQEVGSLLSGALQGTAARVPRERWPSVELNDDSAVIYGLLSRTPVGVDLLIEESQQSPGRVLEILMELEIAGLACQLPGQRYVRA